MRGEEEEVLVHKTSSSKSMSGGSMTVEARERWARKSRVCFWRLNCDFHFGIQKFRQESDDRFGWLVGWEFTEETWL